MVALSALDNYHALSILADWSADIGAVSEGFKETVLKTAVPQGTGGSNPPCSDLNHLVQGEVRERPNRAPC